MTDVVLISDLDASCILLHLQTPALAAEPP